MIGWSYPIMLFIVSYVYWAISPCISPARVKYSADCILQRISRVLG